MRVLLAVLLIGIAGCGGEETSPADVATPSSPVKAENAVAGASEAKADKPPAQAADADAVTALKKLGAEIERNEQGEVVNVFLFDTKITDAGLPHLKGLTSLQTLNLDLTEITDAGLVHLKGLTGLQALFLGFTKITDAGLVHVKGLTKMEALVLGGTIVTDAGLVHLKGMTRLRLLGVGGTKVTDAGIADLQKSLPNCRIRK